MVKMSNHWERPISSCVPYLEWSEIDCGRLETWDIRGHSHASYELHIILEGECSVFVENKEHKLYAGQGIVLAPNVFHAPNQVSSKFCRFAAAFLLEQTFEHSLYTCDPPLHQIFDASPAIQDLCYTIFEEISSSDEFLQQEMLSDLFVQLMIRVFRTIKKNHARLTQSEQALNPTEEMAVIDKFFATAPPELRTRKELANRLHCSERQLVRKLYALYGVSFREKLIHARIDFAQHLLRNTDKSVNEISELVGYSDNAAFFRAFRLYTKMTPREYRNQNKTKE